MDIKRTTKNVLFGAFLFLSILAVFTFLKLSIEHNDFSKYSQIIPLASANAQESCNWVETCRVSVDERGTGRGQAAAWRDALNKCTAALQIQLQGNFLQCYLRLANSCRNPCHLGLQPSSIVPCRIVSCTLINLEDRDPMRPDYDYYCDAEASGTLKGICGLEGTHDLF